MSRSASTLNQTQIQNWCRWYRSAQPSYKAHALTAVLRSDGPRMLAAVLNALKLEDSNALVADWQDDASSTSSSRKTISDTPSEDA